MTFISYTFRTRSWYYKIAFRLFKFSICSLVLLQLMYCKLPYVVFWLMQALEAVLQRLKSVNMSQYWFISTWCWISVSWSYTRLFYLLKFPPQIVFPRCFPHFTIYFVQFPSMNSYFLVLFQACVFIRVACILAIALVSCNLIIFLITYDSTGRIWRHHPNIWCMEESANSQRLNKIQAHRLIADLWHRRIRCLAFFGNPCSRLDLDTKISNHNAMVMVSELFGTYFMVRNVFTQNQSSSSTLVICLLMSFFRQTLLLRISLQVLCFCDGRLDNGWTVEIVFRLSAFSRTPIPTIPWVDLLHI